MEKNSKALTGFPASAWAKRERVVKHAFTTLAGIRADSVGGFQRLPRKNPVAVMLKTENFCKS